MWERSHTRARARTHTHAVGGGGDLGVKWPIYYRLCKNLFMYITLCISFNNHNYNICMQSAGVAIPVSSDRIQIIRSLDILFILYIFSRRGWRSRCRASRRSSRVASASSSTSKRRAYIIYYIILYYIILYIDIFLLFIWNVLHRKGYACMYMHACVYDSSIGRPQTDACVVINFAFK